MAINDNKPVFTIQPNAHLLCSLCKHVYDEPVININCGHTFCKNCIFPKDGITPISCPVDNSSCAGLGVLVPNKALAGQIEDLEVYCSNGFIWSEEKQDWITDPNGCSQKIKYGERALHESSCDFAMVPCPNDSHFCGKYRRREIFQHKETCPRVLCFHSALGCKFVGSKHAVVEHSTVCGYRDQLPANSLSQMKKILDTNVQLTTQVENLSRRVGALENIKDSLSTQLLTTVNLLQQLEQKCNRLEEKMEKALMPRKSSISDMRQRTQSSMVKRTPSSSSIVSVGSSPSSVEGWTMPFQFKCVGTLRGHKDAIWCLKAKDNILFSSGEDAVIKVWDLNSLELGCKHTMTGHTKRVQALATSRNYLYSGGEDRSIRVWSLADWSEVKVVENAHTDIIASILWAVDYLFSSSHRIIKVWDIETLQLLHTMSDLHHWVRTMTLNPTKDKVYSGSHNTVEMWDCVGKFSLKSKITHTYGSVYSLAVTHQYIVAGTYNRNLHVFDVATHQYIQTLTGHVGTIHSLEVSPSGRFLFSASGDSSVLVWNLEKRLPIQPLSRHEGSVNSLVLCGDLLLTGSEDTEIKVFKYFKMEMGFAP